MAKTTFLIGAALLCSCAGSWSEPAGPDTYSIGCKRSRANCYEEANFVCPDGFAVLDGASNTSYVASGNSLIPIYGGEMLVQCKRPAPVVVRQAQPPSRESPEGGVTIITRDAE